MKTGAYLKIPAGKLCRAYQSGTTTAELATTYGCRPETIVAHLRRTGVDVPRGPRGSRRKVGDPASVLAARDAGMSLAAIARVYGASATAVWKIVRRAESRA